MVIDLHIHSSYSDGTDSAVEILKKASCLHLDYISITDHNSCLAYKELDSCSSDNLPKNIKVIVGCEFTTSFEGHMIEVLGYGFDYNAVQDYLDKEVYSRFKGNSTIKSLMEEKIQKKALHIDLLKVRELKFPHERAEAPYYEALKRDLRNLTVIDEPIWDTFGNFFRKGVMNPQSSMYLDYPQYYPSLDDICTIIHQNGGCAFLAHPFQYRLPQLNSFLNRIFNNSMLDGIECYHTTFTDQQIQYLLSFANYHNLLVSGGSDYHGKNKTDHNLGCGCGNLRINADILNHWPISFYSFN